MVDLRKLLDGVPGLLVMSCCALVGVAIGFSIALSTEYWIKASDGLANLWGGIIGAGLGTAGAVLGAIYVQGRDRQMQLIGPASALDHELQEIETYLGLVLYELARTGYARRDIASRFVIMRRWLWPNLRRLEHLAFEHQLGRRITKRVGDLQHLGASTYKLTREAFRPRRKREYVEDFGFVKVLIGRPLKQIGELRALLAPLCAVE